MSRIRTVKPELFKHEGLYEAEIATKLPLRLAFIGLFICCDREGRFKWKPQRLKLDLLPYDNIDLTKILDALVDYGFINKYEVEGNWYGAIPTWSKHQHINHREMSSDIPAPSESVAITKVVTKQNITSNSEIDACFTGDPAVPDASEYCPGKPGYARGEYGIGNREYGIGNRE